MTTATRTFIPRRWQDRGLNQFEDWVTQRQKGDSRTFTAAITGAAGKTHWGAMLTRNLLDFEGFNTVMVVAPSNVILNQWWETFNEHGIEVKQFTNDPDFSAGYHGLITTYKMLENNAGSIRRYINAKTLLIFDECHHLADSRMWGIVASDVATNAGYRLMLTGTPFREDDAKIPFVTYKNGQLVTNFEYTYGEALKDGHVRPVYFHALDSHSKWQLDTSKEGSFFVETASQGIAQQILNTAINPQYDWLKKIIEEAHQTLIRQRVHISDAAGIITCADQDHARKVQRLIQKLTHTNPVLAISDDKDSDEKIEKFRDSDTEWLVVVRKGSEGLDIPRFHVGVWATNVTTSLSFLQFLYRIIRQRHQQTEQADFFMPAHPKLLEYVQTIREMRIHIIAPPEEQVERVIHSNGNTGSQAVFEALSATPGETTDIAVTDHPDDTLDLLIKIREYAAGAIDDYARFQAEISLNAALYDIRQILSIPEPSTPTTQKRSPAQEYEYLRQWNTFVDLFNHVKNGKDWYRQVLSYFWHHKRDGVITGTDLAKQLSMPSSRFTDHWKRDFKALLDTGLVGKAGTSKLYYTSKIQDRISQIAPDHDTETLVGYLLTGQIPETIS